MASTMEMSHIADVMKERRSTRKYDTDQLIPEETLRQILELAVTAPSAWNLQHWKLVLIRRQEQKERMFPAAFNQQQVLDCSALVVVLGDQQADKNADRILSDSVEAGVMTEEVKQAIAGNVEEAYRNDGFGYKEALKNAPLIAMQLMLAAKAHGVDTGPMGGFDPEAVREVLNVPSRYLPVMLVTMGYARETVPDTIRLPLDETVVEEQF